MDPSEERRHSKKQKEYCDMLGLVEDSQYGIPRRCACVGRIIDEVRGKEDYDSHPGKRYFTCINYEVSIFSLIYVIKIYETRTVSNILFSVVNKDNGLHYSHPWVVGVQEEMERLRKRLEEAEEVIKGVWSLNYQIESLQEQVRSLTVQVGTLEKVCFD
uniref:Uncharacterized protein n=1 Tax=Brassica oleracea var. oleracea TaxID=109376 RepID=A0A0D3CJZ3_BRAOL